MGTAAEASAVRDLPKVGLERLRFFKREDGNKSKRDISSNVYWASLHNWTNYSVDSPIESCIREKGETGTNLYVEVITPGCVKVNVRFNISKIEAPLKRRNSS